MKETKKDEIRRSLRKIRNLMDQLQGMETKLMNLQQQIEGVETSLDREKRHLLSYGISDLSKIPTSEISEKKEIQSKKQNDELEQEKRRQLINELKDFMPSSLDLENTSLEDLLFWKEFSN